MSELLPRLLAANQAGPQLFGFYRNHSIVTVSPSLHRHQRAGMVCCLTDRLINKSCLVVAELRSCHPLRPNCTDSINDRLSACPLRLSCLFLLVRAMIEHRSAVAYRAGDADCQFVTCRQDHLSPVP